MEDSALDENIYTTLLRLREHCGRRVRKNVSTKDREKGPDMPSSEQDTAMEAMDSQQLCTGPGSTQVRPSEQSAVDGKGPTGLYYHCTISD